MKMITDQTLPPPFRVGDFEIRRIVEMRCHFRPIADMFPLAQPDEIAGLLPRLQPWALDQDTNLIVEVQSYLVKTPQHTILLDTCIGCDKTNTRIPFWAGLTNRGWFDRLAQAGVSPGDVTHVLCTHLHPDHAGWNTQLIDGRWVPTFPNARYIFSRTEAEHCQTHEAEIYQDSVLPVIASGQAELVEMDHQIENGIWLEPTPGHTPGHVAIHLQSRGEHAVMWGDLLHSPAQCAYPHWSYVRDADGAQTTQSRKRVLETCVEHNHLVLSSHFPSPSVGHIKAEGGAFWFHTDHSRERGS